VTAGWPGTGLFWTERVRSNAPAGRRLLGEPSAVRVFLACLTFALLVAGYVLITGLGEIHDQRAAVPSTGPGESERW
jgi:hypothetical protein